VGDFTLMVYDDQIPFPARGMAALLIVNTVPKHAGEQTRERARRSMAVHQEMLMFKFLSPFFLVAVLVSALGCAAQQQSPGAYIDDSWITTKVKSAILADPALKVAQINVETYKGEVQLSGFVDSAESRDKAVALARSVEGVSSVQNSMQLR
jgi:hyperosmotically inducible protein